MPRLEPLAPGTVAEAADLFAGLPGAGHSLATRQPIFQRKPGVLGALRVSSVDVTDPGGKRTRRIQGPDRFVRIPGSRLPVPNGPRRWGGATARHRTRAPGGGLHLSSELLFSAAERAGPAPAMAASAQPNEVDDALFARMTQAWTEWRMVEIVSVTSLFGFFSRFNATLATPRENPPGRTAAAHLFTHRREAGKHAR